MEKLNSTIRWGHDTLVSIFYYFLKLTMLTQDFIFTDLNWEYFSDSYSLSLPPSLSPCVCVFKGPGNDTS